jgi:hypothetical protein
MDLKLTGKIALVTGLTVGKSGIPTKYSSRHKARVWTGGLVTAAGIAAASLVLIYRPVKIEGTSMTPLLSDHEAIVLSRRWLHKLSASNRSEAIPYFSQEDGRLLERSKVSSAFCSVPVNQIRKRTLGPYFRRLQNVTGKDRAAYSDIELHCSEILEALPVQAR